MARHVLGVMQTDGLTMCLASLSVLRCCSRLRLELVDMKIHLRILFVLSFLVDVFKYDIFLVLLLPS